jgi:hypothetical protein
MQPSCCAGSGPHEADGWDTATFSLRPAVPGVGASLPIRGANARWALCPARSRRAQARYSKAAALLAQSVEHLHGKEGVVGSSPTEGLRKPLQMSGFFGTFVDLFGDTRSHAGRTDVESASSPMTPLWRGGVVGSRPSGASRSPERQGNICSRCRHRGLPRPRPCSTRAAPVTVSTDSSAAIDTPGIRKPGLAMECGVRRPRPTCCGSRPPRPRTAAAYQTQTRLDGGARRAFELHGLVQRQRNEHDQHE